MKLFALPFLSAAIAALTWFGAAPQAEARPHRHGPPVHHRHHHHHPASRIFVSGYASCGTPIYQERFFIRYDRRGAPVWGYRTLPLARHHSRPVPPPRRFHHHHRPYGPGSGVIIQGTIRL